MNKLRTIFYGTSEFGLPALQWLFDNSDLQAVITTPDKPSGRKQELIPSPIKAWALRQAQDSNLKLLQPEDLKDEAFQNILRDLDPDVAVVASYGKIIPQAVLDIPKHKSLNLHPSLLPKYRGATPVQNALLNGDKVTGTTLMLMDAQMDHGPILVQKEFETSPTSNYLELHQDLGKLSADILAENLDSYISGKLIPQPQDDSQATLVKLLTKEDGKIDWTQPAESIENKIRAFTPWPTAWAVMKDDKTMKIFKVKITEEKLNPGETKKEEQRLLVGTGSTALEILELQVEGSKKMGVNDFLRGFRGELKFV